MDSQHPCDSFEIPENIGAAVHSKVSQMDRSSSTTSPPLSVDTRPAPCTRLSVDSAYGPSPSSEEISENIKCRSWTAQLLVRPGTNEALPATQLWPATSPESVTLCRYIRGATTTTCNGSLQAPPSKEDNNASLGVSPDPSDSALETHMLAAGHGSDEGEELDTDYDTDSDTHSLAQIPGCTETTSSVCNDFSNELEAAMQDHNSPEAPITTQRSKNSRTQTSGKYASDSNNKKRKADTSRLPDGGGEGDDDRKKRQPGPDPTLSYRRSSFRKLACPYVKRFPNTDRKSACIYPGFPSVSRLKEHIYRSHKRPPHCLRCYETFRDEPALRDHHNAPERCTQASEIPDIEGITAGQERLLRSKKRMSGDSGEEKKWEAVYFILFPDQEGSPPPSPYCDRYPHVQCPHFTRNSFTFMALGRASHTSPQDLLQQQLQTQLGNEGTNIDEGMRSMMLRVMHNTLQSLLGATEQSFQQLEGAHRELAGVPNTLALSSQDSAESGSSGPVFPSHAYLGAPAPMWGNALHDQSSFGSSSSLSELAGDMQLQARYPQESNHAIPGLPNSLCEEDQMLRPVAMYGLQTADGRVAEVSYPISEDSHFANRNGVSYGDSYQNVGEKSSGICDHVSFYIDTYVDESL